MARTSDELRYELKFVLPPREAGRAFAALGSHRSCVRSAHPTRRVQSIYLGPSTDDALDDGGDARRATRRVRWYGDADAVVQAQLESKQPRGELTRKRVAALGGSLAVANSTPSDFLSAVRDLAPLPWRDELARHAALTFWIRYRRSYSCTWSGRVRVTVDEGLEAFDLRGVQRVKRATRVPLPEIVIVELKADVSAFDELRELSDALGFAPQRCSKLALAAHPRSLLGAIGVM